MPYLLHKGYSKNVFFLKKPYKMKKSYYFPQDVIYAFFKLEKFRNQTIAKK